MIRRHDGCYLENGIRIWIQVPKEKVQVPLTALKYTLRALSPLLNPFDMTWTSGMALREHCVPGLESKQTGRARNNISCVVTDDIRRIGGPLTSDRYKSQNLESRAGRRQVATVYKGS